jgi:hypothetical protein
MAKKPRDASSDPFKDWVRVKMPKGADTAKPSKPDRVAQEARVVVEKYIGADALNPGKKPPGNPHGLGHADLELFRKKGSALDSGVSAKTFVLSKNKIVGTQG